MVMETLLGAFLQVAFDRLATPILQDFKRVCDVEEALDGLEKTLKQARALLRDADRRLVNYETDQMWLRELEVTAYEADDLVDEFYYAALRHRAEEELEGDRIEHGDEVARSGNRHRRVRKRDKVKRFFQAVVGTSSYQFRHDMAERILEVTNKFEAITKRHQELNPGMLTSRVGGGGSGSPEGGSIRRETSSLVSEPYVLGRKAEVEQIVETLLRLNTTYGCDPSDILPTSRSSPSSSFATDENALPVLPIIGIAGLGKTTLAQLVYNDNRVMKHFELLMWVCVSNNFDLRRLTRQIFDYVATTEEKSSADSTHLDVLQTNLRHKLEGKRFLLVLDDLWNHERDEWNKLRAPLICGQRGSAVLVTTRHDMVAETVATMDPVRLQGLSFDDCNELLLRCASVKGDLSKSYFSDDICRKLVQKIKGVPLAVKTLGNILASKKVNNWEEILEREIWELDQSESDILPVLKLSYEDLPSHLKRCFAYCSIFPVDYEFDKLKLVKLWMAQDFIQTQRSTERMEDLGSSYFDELFKRSFFQKVDKHYIMHTLYHSLAQSIPNHRSVRITKQNSVNGIKYDCLLHMSLSIPKVKEIESKLNPSNHLRSFVFTREFSATTDYFNLPLDLTNTLFSVLRCLRVLDLSGSSINSLPESVGSLVHLRFLDISQTKVEVLPNSMSQLYNLQSLELKHCQCLKEIPSGVQNLVNLRHLNASDDLVGTLPGIGKLVSLQELKRFNASTQKGHMISELKNLNELRDKLWIYNIQSIESKEEAIEADLKKKKHLHELVLEWSAGFGSKTDCESIVDVLEELQPHENLKVLSIIGNSSWHPPGWMNNYLLSNLTSISLRDCRNWRSLPPLGALRHLEYLKVEYLLSVEEVGPQFYGSGVAFPSLKALEFRHMQFLKMWVVPSGQTVFPHLEKLVVEDCPQMESVPFPSLLKILKIEKCPKLLINFNLLQSKPSFRSLSWSFENSYPDLPTCVAHTLQHLSSLESLEVSFCDEGETDRRWSQKPLWMPYSYSHGRAFDELNISNLKFLSIHEGSDIRLFLFYACKYPDYPNVNCRDMCLRIRNYDSDDVDGYSSLSICLQDHLVSLLNLSIKGCEKIEPLIGNNTLSCLKSLQTLNIDSCKGMASLGWFPRHKFITLRLLKIVNCPDFTIFPALKLTMLEKLHVENSEDLLSMDMRGLISLKCLEIVGCSKLNGKSIVGSLLMLEELKLRRCPYLICTLNDVKDWLQGLTSLKMLEISFCQNLRELPANLQALTSLKSLLIMKCPEVGSLPGSGLPRMLNELRIDGCPLLQQNCQMGGSEWPKVSHIPMRTINCPKCSPFKCRCN